MNIHVIIQVKNTRVGVIQVLFKPSSIFQRFDWYNSHSQGEDVKRKIYITINIGVKGDNDSAVKEHHLFYSHSSGFDDFSILASKNNSFKDTLMESLLINRDHPLLNKNRYSLPLELFDDWGT